jgi:hypothetical protein
MLLPKIKTSIKFDKINASFSRCGLPQTKWVIKAEIVNSVSILELRQELADAFNV